MATAALDAKAALKTLADTLYPDAYVSWGHPGTKLPNDIVVIGDIDSTSEVATMRSTRPRDETLAITVTFSCYRGGTDQQAVTTAALGMLDELDTALRTTDPTLSGVALWARLTNYAVDESYDAATLAKGRLTTVVAVITIRARI